MLRKVRQNHPATPSYLVSLENSTYQDGTNIGLPRFYLGPALKLQTNGNVNMKLIFSYIKSKLLTASRPKLLCNAIVFSVLCIVTKFVKKDETKTSN